MLSRMLQIVLEKDELLLQLEKQSVCLRRVREYADDPLSYPVLAASLVRYSQERYSETLEKLRTNRIEASGLLTRDRSVVYYDHEAGIGRVTQDPRKS